MPVFNQLDVYHDPTPRSAALNMALDEALLESANRPAIRFYRWDHPALSFGYFGKFRDVESFAAEWELVRRWTGGGIVFHGNDLTYGLIIPAALRELHTSSKAVYAAVHAALRDVLRQYGHGAQLATEEAPPLSDACFERAVVADVLAAGRKVAGAAHRRTRAGLLHQGSIQEVANSPDLAANFASALSAECHAGNLDSPIVAAAQAIAAQKYATNAWLCRW